MNNMYAYDDGHADGYKEGWKAGVRQAIIDADAKAANCEPIAAAALRAFADDLRKMLETS